jgi:hydrogenase expression/formation protein HypE
MTATPSRPDLAADLAADLSAWTCPAPLRDYPRVVMGHGGGGAMSAELVEHLFLPAFGPAGTAGDPDGLGDCAVLTDPLPLGTAGAQLAFSTDSYVVRPLFFPGGSIGELAVNGTVNDLAVSGARPLWLSVAFILEEGLELAELSRVARAMGRAATAAGVRLVTGDTKVVDAGHGDGVYITTAGVGVLAGGVDIRPSRVRPGDAVLVSGQIGVHGVTVLSCRDGLSFATELASDTAPLTGLVEAMLAVDGGAVDGGAVGGGAGRGSAGRGSASGRGGGGGGSVHALRDPTRGGLAAALNEIARAAGGAGGPGAGVGVEINERDVPVPPAVADACGLLGLDPFYVANEGKLVAFVAPGDAERVLAAMRDHPLGRDAAIIGTAVEDHPGIVTARTGLGASRIVDLPLGEQLPRIC